MLKVNEIFYSIQGEGPFTGMPALFVRLAECNLKCSFCDTKHEKYIEYTSGELANEIFKFRVKNKFTLVVFTGGEPLLQREGLKDLICLLLSHKLKLQIETNGTVPAGVLTGLCTIVCSPKTSPETLRIEECSGLKILYPYIDGLSPENISDQANHLVKYTKWKSLQPIDVGDYQKNQKIISKAIQEVKRLGGSWRLGLQIHKIIGEQ